MSQPKVAWRTTVRGDAVEGSLSAFLDDCFTTTQGAELWRGPNGWGLGPCRSEIVPLIGVAATTGGAIKAWQPASGGIVVVKRCLVYVSQASNGAANLTAGVASGPTTSATNLITASAVGSTGFFDSFTLQIAASAAVSLLMPTSNYVTFQGSATTVGMIGEALIEYWPI